LLVFTVGWLFDFLAWEWTKKWRKKWVQKRAPKIVRKMKLEWLWRLITDPKRNYKKVKNSFAIFPYILRYLLLKKE
jgi:UDP-N-acetyl-D-mannosaminuronic acid transferase (WecB/TagA/CpsF family)